MQVFYKDSIYKKVEDNEVIKEGAIHMLKTGGKLKPIMGFDTVGDTPSSFSDDRIFFNLVKKEK